MWFKNLRVYRFTHPFSMTADELENALNEGEFVPCNSQDMSRYGWVSPITGEGDDDASLVHACQGYFMICAKKQEKVLPAAVINDHVDDKVAVINEAEGRPVGRKERQSIKDDVIMELLPRAFTRSRLEYAYIAPKQGHIVINAGSAARAEEMLGALRDCVGSLPVVPLVSKQLPYQSMTHWVNTNDAPAKFILGDECELADPKETSSVIRCKHQDLGSDEINNFLQAEMIVTKLHLQWHQGIDFILDDELAIKRVRFADDIQEKADSTTAEDKAQVFDMEFAVMTLEITALIEDLTAALGGINTDNASVEEIIAGATKSEADQSGVDEVTFAE